MSLSTFWVLRGDMLEVLWGARLFADSDVGPWT